MSFTIVIVLNICYLVIDGLNTNVIQLIEHEHLRSLFMLKLLSALQFIFSQFYQI